MALWVIIRKTRGIRELERGVYQKREPPFGQTLAVVYVHAYVKKQFPPRSTLRECRLPLTLAFRFTRASLVALEESGRFGHRPWSSFVTGPWL